MKEDLQHIAIVYKVKLASNENIKVCDDGLDSFRVFWYNLDDLKLEDLSPIAAVVKEE